MPQIIALWAPPRSTGTAFEWMMRQRGDVKCFHEPFGRAWHQGESPLWPRFERGDPSIQGLTIDSEMTALDAQAQRSTLFIRESPNHVAHIWDAQTLPLFAHTFLIRNPAKALLSLHHHAPEISELEVGFAEQRALFEQVSEATGQTPFVMDADDLLDNQQKYVAMWCTYVGLDFDPAALSWPKGAWRSTLWRTDPQYHASLLNSEGLTHQPSRYGDLNDLPDRLKAIYLRIKPHYDHLYNHRVQG